MALNPKSLVYQGREGTGAAQVFDTTGASKWEIEKIKRLGEEDEKKEDEKKQFKEDIDMDIDLVQPWSQDNQIYNDMINWLIDEKADIKANMENGVTPELRKRYSDWEKKNTEAELFGNKTMQYAKLYNSAFTELGKNSDEYDKGETDKNLWNFKFAGGIEYDPNSDDPFEVSKQISSIRDNTNDLLIGSPNFDTVQYRKDLVDGVKKLGKHSKTYYPNGKLIVTTETKKYFRDDVSASIKTEYTSGGAATRRFYDDNFGVNIDGYDEMNQRKKAEALASNEEAVNYFMPEDFKGVTASGSGGYGGSLSDSTTPTTEKLFLYLNEDKRKEWNQSVDNYFAGLSDVEKITLRNVAGMTDDSAKEFVTPLYGKNAFTYTWGMAADKGQSFTANPETDRVSGGDVNFDRLAKNRSSFTVYGSNNQSTIVPVNKSTGESYTEDELKSGIADGSIKEGDLEFKKYTTATFTYRDGGGELGLTIPLSNSYNLYDADSREEIDDEFNKNVEQMKRDLFGNQSQQNNQQQEGSQIGGGSTSNSQTNYGGVSAR